MEASEEKCVRSGISNYDVLWTPGQPLIHSDNSRTQSRSSHIGNMRFQVDLDLNRVAYRGALKASDTKACDAIVDDIIDTIKRKSGGHFLRVEPDKSSTLWRDLGPEETRLLVRQALIQSIQDILDTVQERPPSESSASTEPSYVAMPPPQPMILALPPDPASAPLSNVSSTLSCHPVLLLPPPSGHSSIGSGRSIPLDTRPLDSWLRINSMTTKRRQEVISPGTTFDSLGMSALSARPQIDPSFCIRLPPASSTHHQRSLGISDSALVSSPGGVVLSLASMDVVLTSSRQNLLPLSHVGNNRFRVFMEIQSRSFAKEPTLERQLAVVRELYDTVTIDWSSNFFCVNPASSTGLANMSLEQAQFSILVMLQLQNGPSLPPTALPQLLFGHAPMQALVASSQLSSPIRPPTHLNSVSDLAIPKSDLCSTLQARNAGTGINLARLGAATSHGISLRQLRRKSVEALKSKKARQDTMRRLEEKQSSSDASPLGKMDLSPT